MTKNYTEFDEAPSEFLFLHCTCIDNTYYGVLNDPSA